MPDAPTANPPAPTAAAPKESRVARLLALVRKLIDYGRELAATLQRDAATPPREFNTTDIALKPLTLPGDDDSTQSFQAHSRMQRHHWGAELFLHTQPVSGFGAASVLSVAVVEVRVIISGSSSHEQTLLTTDR